MVIAGSGEEEPPLLGGFSNLDNYQRFELIGEGAFGQVYRAEEINTGEIVALKKVKLDMYGKSQEVPEKVCLEIEILEKLNHPNVISLKEVVISSDKNEGGIYMVFEYMDFDLATLAKRVIFTAPVIKYYMKQLLTGLEYCHANQVLHRDIKGANILLCKKGNLKLADFGQSRFMNEDIDLADGDTGSDSETHHRDYDLQAIMKQLTNSVITLPYRPPEILLGSTKYGPEVDIWSVGCVFAQLLNKGSLILLGHDKYDQLKKIFELCGTPNEENWPGVSDLHYFDKAKEKLPIPMKRCVKEKYGHFDHHALELLDKMLVLDPIKRISATEALADAYFSTDPLPCDPKRLPSYE